MVAGHLFDHHDELGFTFDTDVRVHVLVKRELQGSGIRNLPAYNSLVPQNLSFLGNDAGERVCLVRSCLTKTTGLRNSCVLCARLASLFVPRS